MDTLWRALAIYFGLLVVLRGSGKRSLSQVTTFDFVLLLIIGEAVQNVCADRDPQFRRVNLEIQGNHDAFLHAHVWPRYEWEGPDHVWRPVALHPIERWRAPLPHTVLGPQHDDLRAELQMELSSMS